MLFVSGNILRVYCDLKNPRVDFGNSFWIINWKYIAPYTFINTNYLFFVQWITQNAALL